MNTVSTAAVIRELDAAEIKERAEQIWGTGDFTPEEWFQLERQYQQLTGGLLPIPNKQY